LRPEKDFGKNYPDYGFIMDAGDAFDNICISNFKNINNNYENITNDHNDICLIKFSFKLCS
jgi:hypothetical protein